jgi:predicted ATPase
MFTKMRMINFKSWTDTGEIRLAPLTGFFGTNSSGKSSLLQMLLLLKQTTESNDRRLPLKTGSQQDGYVNLGTVSDIIHGNNTDLTMSLQWQLPVPSPQDRDKDDLPPLQRRQKLSGMALLKGFGTKIAQSRVPSLTIVPNFNVLKECLSCHLA